MREDVQRNFKKAIRTARARYTVTPSWRGTIRLDGRRERKSLKRLGRQAQD